MTRYQPLWQQAGSYAASQDRLLMQSLWPGGSCSGGVTTAVAGTMNVSIAPGFAAVPLQAGQGVALCRWDAAEVVTLSAAPPSGQSRIDLIVAQVQDNALDAGGNNAFIFTAIAGTPAASAPATPATPTNAMAIATVTVVGAVANLNAAVILDLRTTQQAVTAGGTPILVGSTPGAPPFQNGWANSAPPAQPVRFMLQSSRVYVEGAVAGGTAGAVIFTLPLGYRPQGQHWFLTRATSTATFSDTVSIRADGTVTPDSAAGNVLVSLAAISFDIR
jgi:hypothetical protein